MDKSNSLSKHIADIERLNRNALALCQAMFEATTTDKENATAILELYDGTKRSVIVPSNLFLKAEVQRLRESVLNITGLSEGNSGALISISAEEGFREIFLSSFKKSVDALKLSELDLDKNINVEQNPLIDRLLSPLTCARLQLPSRFENDKNVAITKIFVEEFGAVTDGMTYIQTISILQTAKIDYSIKREIVKTDPKKMRFYGAFDIFDIKDNGNDSFTCRFNKKTYSDSNSPVVDSRELDVNAHLVTSDGLTKFKVKSVVDNGQGIFVTIQPLGGYGKLLPGLSVIEYLDSDGDPRTVSIPIKGQDKFIMFVSSIGAFADVEGVHSVSKLVRSSDFKVLSNNIEYDFDSYFATNILSLGNHLESIVRDNSVPRFLAETIPQPVLNTDYFKVQQVNKHITDSATTEKILKYSAEKNRINSDLSIINEKISALSNTISKGQYRSRTEKSKDEAELTRLINEKDTKQKLFNTTVSNISSLGSFVDAPKATPKYKIQGFWAIDEPTSTVTGDLQRIVQYNVRFKYVPTNSDASNTTSINVGGQEGVISAWNEFKTVQLLKEYDAASESFKWAEVKISDGNVNNVNQLEIPISYGESVIIQVQAISEAGFPGNPSTSEWSAPMKVLFPEELAQDEQVKSIVESNQDDVIKVEVEKEFASRGISTHVSRSYTEQERYFSHPASEISSGQYTAEQKTISQEELNKDYLLRISKLEEIVSRRNTSYSVELVGPNGRVYPVNRLSTVNVFAGHYTDYVNVNQESEYGNIVETIFYLKLINRNATSAEISSLSPGVLTQATENALYNLSSYALVADQTARAQLNGQLVYIRSKDVAGSEELFVQNTDLSSTEVQTADIDSSAPLALRTVIEYDGSSFSSIKLKDNASGTDYVALTKSHPFYAAYADNTSNPVTTQAVVDEFVRIAKFNGQLLANNAQSNLETNFQAQFNPNDKYVVGKNSTGSRLMLRVSDIQNMQVSSSDPASSIVLHNGEENAIMIPIVYQFRMTDALGRINGDSTLSTTASNIEYNKKLGIDLVVGNDIFKFDLNVNAKFRHTTLSASNQQNNVVISSIDLSSSNKPNIV